MKTIIKNTIQEVYKELETTPICLCHNCNKELNSTKGYFLLSVPGGWSPCHNTCFNEVFK